MSLTTERWNILSKGSFTLQVGPASWENCTFLSSPVIHADLVGCRKTPISDFQLWLNIRISWGNFQKHQRTLTNGHYLCGWCLGRSVSMDHWIWEPLTSNTDFQIWVSIIITEENSSPTYWVRWFWCKTIFANTRFTLKELGCFCFSPSPPISSSCLGNSYHYIF